MGNLTPSNVPSGLIASLQGALRSLPSHPFFNLEVVFNGGGANDQFKGEAVGD